VTGGTGHACGVNVWKAETSVSWTGLFFRGRSDRGSGQGDSLYPVGYLDKQVPDTSVQETDRILVEKVHGYRCDCALGAGDITPESLNVWGLSYLRSVFSVRHVSF
jgi:hypothetical protein